MPFVKIDEKNCFYQDIGSGFPILFGHSYLWDHTMWKPQVEALSKEFRCISFDLWSHGQSDNLIGEVSTKRFADLAWALMQKLSIAEFAVVGLSVGGMWGAELAMAHPEAVKALVLMDTFLGKEPEVTRIKYFGMLDQIEKDGCFTKEMRQKIIPFFFSSKTLNESSPLVDRFDRSLADMKKENIPSIVKVGKAIFSRPDRLDALSKVKIPTAILVGKDDLPRPPKEAEKMSKLIENSQLHVIEEAGHICNLEKPNEVAALLQGFLKPQVNVASTTSSF